MHLTDRERGVSHKTTVCFACLSRGSNIIVTASRCSAASAAPGAEHRATDQALGDRPDRRGSESGFRWAVHKDGRSCLTHDGSTAVPLWEEAEQLKALRRYGSSGSTCRGHGSCVDRCRGAAGAAAAAITGIDHHIRARGHSGEMTALIVQQGVGDMLLFLVILACGVLSPPVSCGRVERGTLLL